MESRRDEQQAPGAAGRQDPLGLDGVLSRGARALLAALLPGLAWAGALWLLEDDPRAFWLTGSLAVLLPAAWKLGTSGVPFWVGNGAVLLGLAVAVTVRAVRDEPAGSRPV